FAPWLAEPVGRLHLAGEHTDQWQATMNGALSSGRRAARMREGRVCGPSTPLASGIAESSDWR
ncbi:MAG: FAD-dependent oxidoreductase, partial [Gemmataceae bacterium]|nr:FAD-dependent oxidoreductase [Gemmataceae bacterium]